MEAEWLEPPPRGPSQQTPVSTGTQSQKIPPVESIAQAGPGAVPIFFPAQIQASTALGELVFVLACCKHTRAEVSM